MPTICGKALLVITRIENRRNGDSDYDVYPYIQSCNGRGEYARDSAYQDLLELTSYLGLPDAAEKMQIGDRFRIYVTYRLDYYQSYEGEWDVSLEYGTQRVLRRQKLRTPYISKTDR